MNTEKQISSFLQWLEKQLNHLSSAALRNRMTKGNLNYYCFIHLYQRNCWSLRNYPAHAIPNWPFSTSAPLNVIHSSYRSVKTRAFSVKPGFQLHWSDHHKRFGRSRRSRSAVLKERMLAWKEVACCVHGESVQSTLSFPFPDEVEWQKSPKEQPAGQLGIRAASQLAKCLCITKRYIEPVCKQVVLKKSNVNWVINGAI